MKVETRPIDDVKPYPKNPRKNAGAVAKVMTSLREFGWRQPIVVDAKMVVIVGHTRLLAAQELGMTEVPVHIATGLSAKKVKAYRLADNRTGEEAEWDQDLLRVELSELQSNGFDLDLTGFDQDEIARALADGLPTAADAAPAHASTEARVVCCPSCSYRWTPTSEQDE